MRNLGGSHSRLLVLKLSKKAMKATDSEEIVARIVAAAEYAAAFRLKSDPAQNGRLFLAALLQVSQGPLAPALTPYTSNLPQQCQEEQRCIYRCIILMRPALHLSDDKALQQFSYTLLSACMLDLIESRTCKAALALVAWTLKVLYEAGSFSSYDVVHVFETVAQAMPNIRLLKKCLVHTSCESQAQTELVELMSAMMHQEAQLSACALNAGEQ